MIPLVVGLAGKAGTGKDFLTASVLQPLGFHQFSYAWPLKTSLIARGLATYDEVFRTKPEHVRRLLQEEGTERGRDVYGQDYWCMMWSAWVTLLTEAWGITRFAIPDVRFPNEVTTIQALGGKVYRIVAPTRATSAGLTEAQRMHASEVALDRYSAFDGRIYNDVGELIPSAIQLIGLLVRDGMISREEAALCPGPR